MTEEKVEQQKKIASGLDIGTMNIVCSKSDTDEFKITRNVFLPLDRDEIHLSELTNISYVESEAGELYIIGEDAFRMANIFGHGVSRPMEKGLISPSEVNAIDVLTLIIKSLFGNIKDKEVYCSYSIPAEAIDEGKSVTYHEKVFSRVLGTLGVNHTPVNEGMAIIYSECAKEQFSGVGISYGAGMTNCCLAFKGIEVLKFSTAKSGDYIDRSSADALGIVANRITSIKEKHLNLQEGFESQSNKKIKRALEAITYYYGDVINYTIKKIVSEFDKKVDIEIDEALPIVVSGGTSLPVGFIEFFKQTLAKYELPFEVSEVRRAENPLTAVSRGLLIKTMSDIGLNRKNINM